MAAPSPDPRFGQPAAARTARAAGIEPARVVHADIDETPRKAELPRDYALRMAREKAGRPRDAGAFVLAGDTVVAVGRRILPKAEDEATARNCLELLSGRRHRVLSAVALPAPDGERARHALSETQVRFKRALGRGDRGLPGARRMAGQGRRLCDPGRRRRVIAWISGSHSGVVGLPLFETRALLKAGGVRAWLSGWSNTASARSARCSSTATTCLPRG